MVCLNGRCISSSTSQYKQMHDVGATNSKKKMPKVKKKERGESQNLLERANSMQAEAVRATQVGAIANLLLAGGKGFVGYAVGSTGLIADGVNSFGDLFADAERAGGHEVVCARRISRTHPDGLLPSDCEPLAMLLVCA